MKQIAGKKILVTGASGGLGRAIVWQIAALGGIPLLVARSENKLRALHDEIFNRFGIVGEYFAVDITNSADWESTLDLITEKHQLIDGLINNAGIGFFRLVGETEMTEAESMFRLNVLSMIQATQHFLPQFIENKSGHIINIGSQAGKISTPKSAVYGATKHAVIGFSNALRLETAEQGVIVTTVNLGPVQTGFFDSADPSGNYQKSVEKYMLDPEKVAEKIVKHLFTKKREINLPRWMELGSKMYQFAPRFMEKVLNRQFHKK
ncbi:SDR family NAD(P)-dependent oxidoreductase [Sediminibacillus massiliensis]|uniref:SDR family NAD(P)-dependent oxidoreductase n=1 Tax=Sediminibacillus massiliensis TaxID=1926277 RepID=UPI0009884B50|nr:SDR family oxidoreductase [Sediminibacillus massiliensis]